MYVLLEPGVPLKSSRAGPHASGFMHVMAKADRAESVASPGRDGRANSSPPTRTGLAQREPDGSSVAGTGSGPAAGLARAERCRATGRRQKYQASSAAPEGPTAVGNGGGAKRLHVKRLPNCRQVHCPGQDLQGREIVGTRRAKTLPPARIAAALANIVTAASGLQLCAHPSAAARPICVKCNAAFFSTYLHVEGT